MVARSRRVERRYGGGVLRQCIATIADIAAAQPDAVTIDIGRKKGNGFDVLEAIAIAHEKPPLRIVLTNYATGAYREAARCLGAEYFFDKAKQIRELIDVLASYKKWGAAPA